MTVEAMWQEERLVLSTGRMERCWRWSDGSLRGESIRDLATGARWQLDPQVPELGIAGVDLTAGRIDVEQEEVAATAAWHAYLAVRVTITFGSLQVRRVFRLYDGCPAIVGEVWLRGEAAGPWRQNLAEAGDLHNIERLSQAWSTELPGPHVERLTPTRRHLRLEAVRFYDITDRRNNLVQSERVLPYRAPLQLSGNLLLVRDLLAGDGLFVLKEAPCSDVQLAWPGSDFVASLGSLTPIGFGLDADDLATDAWRQGYSLVTGVGGLDEMRDYQHRRRRAKPGRDHMILVNTWGDRGQDTRLNEAFARRELAACKRLGATHFQLDDGWQKGQSSNSAFAGGSLEGIWSQPDYWEPHPERFPDGLGPLVELARDLGIELCLWFNPSKDDSYAHWRDDAQVLIGIWRRHGIRTFKIDGVVMPDHRAHRNFTAFLDTVEEACEHDVVFNLDVTAGRRWGYHLGAEYGNIFLENRYTDWSNYYPHWSLRNLWQLARYVPAQSLQIEFLNLWRNPSNYPADDPLRPAAVPFAYAFALTMMAQPLAWFEAQSLPPEAFAIAETVRVAGEHHQAMHAGRIFPIGEEPCGTAWTGFQSCRGEHGYLLILREHNERPTARLQLWEAPGPELTCECLAGDGSHSALPVDDEGRVQVSLPRPFSFALYRY